MKTPTYILLIGDLNDSAIVYIGWLSKQRGLNVLQLSENSLGNEWFFSFSDEHAREGCLTFRDQEISLSQVQGAFIRLSPKPEANSQLGLNEWEAQVFIQERRYALRHFINQLSCPVVNKPNSGITNASKPLQMRLLQQAGFVVPQWIVSNDPGKLRDFWLQQEKRVIYKSLSGLWSHVKMLDEATIEQFEEVNVPIICQEFIQGKDCRIHTINQKDFPTMIESGGVDYRFDGEGEKKHTAIEAPKDILERCFDFAQKDGLELAGFDFKIDSKGKWHCLEMNPVPTFLPYEVSTGQKIGEEIVNFLCGRVGEKVLGGRK